MPVLNQADAVRLGGTAVSKVYAGTTLVWPPAVFPKMETLTDSFATAGTPDTTKWTASGAGTITNSGGQLTITVSSGPSGQVQQVQLVAGASSSHARYDLTGSYAQIQLVNAGAADPLLAIVPLWLNDQDYAGTNWNGYFWYILNGTIASYKWIAGVQTQLGSTVTYVPTTHRWLRIREAGGTTFFDTSPDGSSWTNFSSTANVPNTNALEVYIASQVSGTLASSPQTMTLDNFNTPPLPFVTAMTAHGSVRHDFGSYLGMRFNVGAAPIVVTAVGRWVQGGNFRQHNVKITDPSGADIPGTSVTVDTNGAARDAFVYTDLPAPVTLSPSTTYVLCCDERDNQDDWYDCAGTVLTTTAVATISDAVFWTGSWNSGGSQCYVPLSFLYSA